MLFERGKDPRAVLRFALPLSTPEFEGNVKEIQSMGGARSFLVDTSSVYLHPEYLAPPDQISSMKMEFPAVSPKFQGKKYEVAYGIEFRKGVIHGSGITKLDLKKKKLVKALTVTLKPRSLFSLNSLVQLQLELLMRT